MALEQPDLIVATADHLPLLSVEITEQREFGTNAQQRMARFWSAAASGVPSAYLLPIESYQIEQTNTPAHRKLARTAMSRDQLLDLQASVLRGLPRAGSWRKSVTSASDLLMQIRGGTLAVSADRLDDLQKFVSDHVDHTSSVRRISAVPPEEFVHDINGIVYKAYLRTPEVTSSMLLTAMRRCSSVQAMFPFKLHSSVESLFRTNGMDHILESTSHPHLSFRNLPPEPGTGPIIHPPAGKDELSLFIDMTDAAVRRLPIPGLSRELFTEPGLYFGSHVADDWRISGASAARLNATASADFECSTHELSVYLTALGRPSPPDPCATAIDSLLRRYKTFHVYKIQCSVSRSLADPYSGALAVRDVLFCRDNNSGDLSDLCAFQRSEGLIFVVELRGRAASSNTFLMRALADAYRRLVPTGSASSALQQLNELASAVRAEKIPKSIRCHLILCDLIVVRRYHPDRVDSEIVPGIPALLADGLIDRRSPLLASLVA